MTRYRDIRIALLFALRHPWVRRGLGSAIVVAVLLLAVVLFYWRPAHSEHEQLFDRVVSLRRELVKSMQDQTLAKTYADTRKTIARLEKKLNAESGQAALVNNVTQLAQNSGVQVISESYQEGKEDSGYVPLFQIIVLKGAYKDMRQFLMGVQQLPTWTVVQETRLERPHDGKGLKATLTLVTYRKTNQQIGS